MTLTTVSPAFIDDYGAISGTILNLWRTELPYAIDGAEGGDYAPTAPIDIQGSGIGTATVSTLLEVGVGGQSIVPVGAQILDGTGQTFTLAEGQIRFHQAPFTGQNDHEISATGAVPGSWMHFVRESDGAAAAVVLHRVGAGGAIVTLPTAIWCSATLYFDSSGDWRLRSHTSATPGADA